MKVYVARLGGSRVDDAIAYEGRGDRLGPRHALLCAVLEAPGLDLKFSDEQGAAWMDPAARRPLFIVMRPFDGHAASPGNGPMIALLAAERSVVDRCHALALGGGGSDEGAPGVRPEYHPDFYGAYFRDLDGNKPCVCCHDPEP